MLPPTQSQPQAQTQTQPSQGPQAPQAPQAAQGLPQTPSQSQTQARVGTFDYSPHLNQRPHPQAQAQAQGQGDAGMATFEQQQQQQQQYQQHQQHQQQQQQQHMHQLQQQQQQQKQRIAASAMGVSQQAPLYGAGPAVSLPYGRAGAGHPHMMDQNAMAGPNANYGRSPMQVQPQQQQQQQQPMPNRPGVRINLTVQAQPKWPPAFPASGQPGIPNVPETSQLQPQFSDVLQLQIPGSAQARNTWGENPSPFTPHREMSQQMTEMVGGSDAHIPQKTDSDIIAGSQFQQGVVLPNASNMQGFGNQSSMDSFSPSMFNSQRTGMENADSRNMLIGSYHQAPGNRPEIGSRLGGVSAFPQQQQKEQQQQNQISSGPQNFGMDQSQSAKEYQRQLQEQQQQNQISSGPQTFSMDQSQSAKEYQRQLQEMYKQFITTSQKAKPAPLPQPTQPQQGPGQQYYMIQQPRPPQDPGAMNVHHMSGQLQQQTEMQGHQLMGTGDSLLGEMRPSVVSNTNSSVSNQQQLLSAQQQQLLSAQQQQLLSAQQQQLLSAQQQQLQSAQQQQQQQPLLNYQQHPQEQNRYRARRSPHVVKNELQPQHQLMNFDEQRLLPQRDVPSQQVHQYPQQQQQLQQYQQHQQQQFIQLQQQQHQQQQMRTPNPQIQTPQTATQPPNWEAPEVVRREMIRNIVMFLKNRKPELSVHWCARLGARVERSLYIQSASYEEYWDMNTLRERLRQLIRDISLQRRTPNDGSEVSEVAPQTPQAASANSQSETVGSLQPFPGHQTPSVHRNTRGPLPPQSMPRFNPDQPAVGYQTMTRHTPGNFNGQMPQIDVDRERPETSGSLADFLPVMKNEDTDYNTNITGLKRSGVSDISSMLLSDADSLPDDRPYKMKKPDEPSVTPTNFLPGMVAQSYIEQHGDRGGTPTIPSQALRMQMARSTPEQRQQILIQYQQRILLLLHALHCKALPGHCENQSCAGMRELWQHIKSCGDIQCKTPHCLSSRYLVSHYRGCKDLACCICAPVRTHLTRGQQGSLNFFQHEAPFVNSTPGPQPFVTYMIKTDPDEANPPPSHRNFTSTLNQNTSIRGTPAYFPQPASKVAPSTINLVPHPHASPSPTPMSIMSPVGDNLPVSETNLNQLSVTMINSPVFIKLSPLHEFCTEELQQHIRSLRKEIHCSSIHVRKLATPLVNALMDMEGGPIFKEPVDPVALEIPDYFDIIKNPMDLGTIKKNLDSYHYDDLAAFEADVLLTFDNAVLYNGSDSEVGSYAAKMKEKFQISLRELKIKMSKNEQKAYADPESCPICGGKNLKFEPPSYFCSGRCGSRIRRNANFYQGGSTQLPCYYCVSCYGELSNSKPISLPDVTIYKAQLTRKKNEDKFEEPLVECGCCKRWVHQICSMLNHKAMTFDQMYICPLCLLNARAQQPLLPKSLKTCPQFKAKTLPETCLSKFLETRVMDLMLKLFEQDKISGMHLDGLQEPPVLYVRQVSAVDIAQTVRSGMYDMYKSLSYPREFLTRAKCLLMFQTIEGVDVILFGMYVYEYGHTCPQPNHRRVYISYLDSVHYFRPRRLRTAAYHEILIAYMEYVKQRGFHTAHIWACPPLKGDDYILYRKPESQKMPRDERLRDWYRALLDVAVQRGVALDVENLWDDVFKNTTASVTDIPYFEGDYVQLEIENIIKDLEEEAMEKERESERERRRGMQTSTSSVSSKSPPRAHLRSAGAALAQTLGQIDLDPVMTKLRVSMENLKESFFVVRLHSQGFAREAWRRRQRELADTLKSVAYGSLSGDGDRLAMGMSMSMGLVNGLSSHPEIPNGDAEQARVEVKADNDHSVDAEPIFQFGNMCSEMEELEPSQVGGAGKREATSMEIQTPINGQEHEHGSGNCEEYSGEIPDTTDPDDVMECETFDTRQTFLDLCSTNHLQFDQLRRAKHSTMMVLSFLHNNSSTPKLLPTCANCLREISGSSLHCDTCESYELCEDCHRQYVSPPHPHPLRPVPRVTQETRTAMAILTPEERKRRKTVMEGHVRLLEHANRCNLADCSIQSCARMKMLISHFSTCKENKATCQWCKRIWLLLRLHAQRCVREECDVMACRQLKERLRMLQQQQQRMDDRRRQAMNRQHTQFDISPQVPLVDERDDEGGGSQGAVLEEISTPVANDTRNITVSGNDSASLNSNVGDSGNIRSQDVAAEV